MKKEVYMKWNKRKDEIGFGDKVTDKEILVVTTLEAISYAIAGYENTISDCDYTLEQANKNFFENVEDLIDAIEEEVLYNLKHDYNIIFQSSREFVKDFVVSALNYEYNYLVGELKEGMLLDENADLKNIGFNFERSWALNV